MLNYGNLKTQTGNRLGKTDSTFKGKIGEWLNDRYEDIWDRTNWFHLYKVLSATSTADAETFVLDANDIDYIINVHDRINNINLTLKDPSRGGREHADSQDASGSPKIYWPEGISVRAQPSAASVVTVVSDKTGDTTQQVRVWGRDANGVVITDEISLNETTSVDGTVSFTNVDEISKDADTTGVITVTSNSGAVTLARINPKDYAAHYIKIHLVKRPDTAIVYTVTYKRKFRRLVNDSDVPIIPCERALKIGAYCDALREQKKYDAARQLEFNPIREDDPSTYEGAVQQIIRKYKMLAENVEVAIPHTEKDSIDELPSHQFSY